MLPRSQLARAQEGSFHVDTPDNAGDVVMDGESLNGLFAIVEGLQAKVDMLMGVTTTTTTATTETVRPTRRFSRLPARGCAPHAGHACRAVGVCVRVHVGGESKRRAEEQWERE